MIMIKITPQQQWYAVQNGKHLTSEQLQKLIARGTPYQFEPPGALQSNSRGK